MLKNTYFVTVPNRNGVDVETGDPGERPKAGTVIVNEIKNYPRYRKS